MYQLHYHSSMWNASLTVSLFNFTDELYGHVVSATYFNEVQVSWWAL